MKSSVKEITAYEFAGSVYKDKEDAVRAEANFELREFLDTLPLDAIEGSSDNKDLREAILKHMVENYERYITLLNKFY